MIHSEAAGREADGEAQLLGVSAGDDRRRKLFGYMKGAFPGRRATSAG